MMATSMASSASTVTMLHRPLLDDPSLGFQGIHGSPIFSWLRPRLQNPPKSKIRKSSVHCKADVEHGFDLYELLGIDSTSSLQEIKRSYRWLQKKCHPDIAGPIGHDMSILLNEAYTILANPDQRATYDLQRADSTEFDGFNGQPQYSKWFGPENEGRAVFVDETKCIGCLKCALIASKTFAIETRYGRARAVGQWGDPEEVIDDAITACPVDCISWVDRSRLAALEYIMSKQPRFSVGIDLQNNGGVRTGNIFQAADEFIKKHRQQEIRRKTNLQETSAQKEARLAAMEAVQARAGRWWYHFVGKNMSEDATFSKNWDTNGAQSSQRAIVPLSYFRPIINVIESRDDSHHQPGNDSGHGQGGASLPEELEKLFAAAARRRQGGMPPAVDDEYWVPIELSSSSISFNFEGLSERGQNATKKGEYSWTWTGRLSVDETKNSWMKGIFSGIPVVISAVAAMLVGFTSGTNAALSETVMGPLPVEWTSSAGMQVFLAAAVWYIVGAVLSSAAFSIGNVWPWSTKETNGDKY